MSLAPSRASLCEGQADAALIIDLEFHCDVTGSFRGGRTAQSNDPEANAKREARLHCAIVSSNVLPSAPQGWSGPSSGVSAAAPQEWRGLAGLLGLNTCPQQPAVPSSAACPSHNQKHITALPPLCLQLTLSFKEFALSFIFKMWSAFQCVICHALWQT